MLIQAICFRNSFTHWREQDIPQQTMLFWRSNIYVCGTVKQAQLSCNGEENPNDITEQKYDSVKVNVWCDLMKN